MTAARLSPIAPPPPDPLASHRARHADGRDVLVLARLGRVVLIADGRRCFWEASWRVALSPWEEDRRGADNRRRCVDTPLSLAVDPT